MKKTFSFKSFLCGFLVCLLLIGSIGVFADNLTKSIEVFMNDIKVSIDGKDIKMDVEPLIYQNRTYIPVRFVAEEFGKSVSFNETTNKVEIVSNSEVVTVNNSSNSYKEISYADGSKYIGEVKNDKRNGYGTYFYPSTDEKKRQRYDGQWKDDKREGYGTLVWTNGQLLTSLKWVNDDLSDYIIRSTNDGYSYIGMVKNQIPNGLGISIEPENTFMGEWLNDELNGYCIVIKKDGSKASGKYKYNKPIQAYSEDLNNSTNTNNTTINNPIINDNSINTTTTTNNINTNINTNINNVIPTPTPNVEYLNIKKAQYEKDLVDLQTKIDNTKNEKNIKVYNGTEFVWDYDHVKVDEYQKLYDKMLSNFNAWKALNGM